MWGIIVTVLGLPREVAMGALMAFLVVARLILRGVDDQLRSWSDVES
jgi:hypothetical protein